MTSGPMPSPAITAIWKLSLAGIVLLDVCDSGGRAMVRVLATRIDRRSQGGRASAVSADRKTMPRFGANLAYLFTEYPFLDRFAAAAAAGFPAVELQFPYDQAPSDVKAELARHGLTMLGINTPPGNLQGGEFGLAAVPGREQDFATLFRQALDYITAIGGRQLHVLAGRVPVEQRPAAERVFIANLQRAAD